MTAPTKSAMLDAYHRGEMSLLEFVWLGHHAGLTEEEMEAATVKVDRCEIGFSESMRPGLSEKETE